MNECNIVQDLLPLYADDLASSDSVEFIDRHAENCPKCRDIWRRYKGELPITHPPVLEIEEENVLEPLHREVTRFIWKFIGNAVLVILLVGAFLVYLGWETGFAPALKSFPAPVGDRCIELVDRETAGFFTDGEGLIVKFNLGYGVNRYETRWQDAEVSWAPNGMTSLFTIQTAEGKTEIRIVDHTEYVGGGSIEIPGLIPSEEQPDLTHVLTEICKEHPEFPADWETVTFAFSIWGNDSETVTFGFETDSGEAGFVDFYYPSGKITRVYHKQ